MADSTPIWWTDGPILLASKWHPLACHTRLWREDNFEAIWRTNPCLCFVKVAAKVVARVVENLSKIPWGVVARNASTKCMLVGLLIHRQNKIEVFANNKKPRW